MKPAIVIVLIVTALIGVILYRASPALFWVAAAIWAMRWIHNVREARDGE